MNILFCGDDNVCGGICIATLSPCKNTDRDLNIYILTASIDKYIAIPMNFEEKLQNLLSQKGNRGKVRLIDITEKFGSYLPEANLDTRFTPMCMLRLFADLVEEIPDRILYLDTGVLCRADPGGFYDTFIEDVELAGVPDRYGKWFFGNILQHDYMNSGVLLMNMKNIRRSGLFEKCRVRCRDVKMFMPDQSALNKLAVKRKVPRRFNEQGRIRRRTVFKHFTTFFRFFPYFHPVTVKPWQIDEMNSELGVFEFDDILEEYKRSHAE